MRPDVRYGSDFVGQIVLSTARETGACARGALQSGTFYWYSFNQNLLDVLWRAYGRHMTRDLPNRQLYPAHLKDSLEGVRLFWL